jgi:membrane-bound metal-dependent hydrolase YbcI (DUF457 family)
MDTITHGIVGALAGKALFAGRDVPAGLAKSADSQALSSPTARAAIFACTLGSMFPDIDIFAGPLARNPLAIMEWHRNITHSAVLLPLWALLLTSVSLPLSRLLKWKVPPFWNLFAIYALGIVTHIFLDLVTNFGTMVWSPVRYSRPAWDWVFILDLTLTSIALVPQLAAWCYRRPSHLWIRAVCVWAALTLGAFGAYWLARVAGYGFPISFTGVVSAIFAAIIFLPGVQGAGFHWTRAMWCRASLATFCVYVSLAAAAHNKALTDVGHFAAEHHLQVESLAALPLPPTLTHWAGVVSTPEGVWRATFHEPGGHIESSHLYLDSQSLPFSEDAMKLRDVQIYLWFARFPVWRIEHREGNETAVEISDVRFFREGDSFAADPPQGSKHFAAVPPRRAGFTFEVVFDAQKRIVSHGFKEPE